MMNRQIRVEKIIGTVKCVNLHRLLVAQSKFNRYKREIVCRRKAIRQAAPAAICS